MCKLWMQDASKSKHICTYENLSTLTPQHPHKNLNLHQLSKPRQNIAFRYKSLKKRRVNHMGLKLTSWELLELDRKPLELGGTERGSSGAWSVRTDWLNSGGGCSSRAASDFEVDLQKHGGWNSGLLWLNFQQRGWRLEFRTAVVEFLAERRGSWLSLARRLDSDDGGGLVKVYQWVTGTILSNNVKLTKCDNGKAHQVV